MKPHNLLLSILSLATLQASQIAEQQLNTNNTNQQSNNPYTHREQENWQEWIKDIQYKDLQKPLIQLYTDGIAHPTAHIKTTPPVYFLVGPTGAGKSTFIFALQGNKVTQIKQEDKWSDDDESSTDNSNIDDNDTGQLDLKITINLPTPKVAEGTFAVTEGIKIYYTGKNIHEPMAFCDTEGFLGARKDKISKAEKLVETFAPHFALKANPINGIIFLVSSEDIKATRGQNFLLCMHFLKHYFDLAITNNQINQLKQSVILLITKEEGNKSTIGKKLAKIIKAAYTDYYKGLLENNNTKNDTNQKTEKHEPRLGQLKSFFSLFLKENITKDKIHTTKFHKLLDKNKVRFFYPHQKKSLDKIRTKLLQLTPLDPKYLSLQDNPTSQYLINQIIHRAHIINKDIHKTLQSTNLVQLQSLILQKDNHDVLKTLNAKLEQRKKQLNKQNKTILYGKILKCIYDQRHIQDIPLEKREKEKDDLVRVAIHKVTKRSSLGLSVGGSIGGLIGGAKGGLEEGLVGGVVGGLVGGGLGLMDGVFEGIKGLIRHRYQGYLHKHFTYTGDDPIWKIKLKSNNKGAITFYSPTSNFIAQNFNQKVENSTITLTSQKKQGITCHLWHIYHRTAYEENARCYLQFFSKKKDLQASKWQRKDNKNQISRIDDLLQKLETLKKTNKHKLEKDHLVNQSIANNHIKELCKLQEEISMISCWSNRIFKKQSANQELIEQYIANYNEAVPHKYQISIQNDNNYNNIISSYQDNTNSKHNDNQSNQQLKNTNLFLEDEEKQKEDHDNNQNISSSPSHLNPSVPLTVTAILAGLLSQHN